MWILSTIGSIATKKVAKAIVKEWVKKVAPLLTATKVINPTAPKVRVKDIPITQAPLTQGGVTMDNPYADYGDSLNTLEKETSSAKASALLNDYKSFSANEEYKKSQQWVLGSLSPKKTKDLFEVDKPMENNFVDVDKIKKQSKVPLRAQLQEKLTTKIDESINSIARYKSAIKEYKTPWNRIEQNLKKQLWEEKYNKFKENVDMESTYVTALREDEELRNTVPTFTRSLYKGLMFDYALDKITWGNVRALNKAADFLNDTWEMDENNLTMFAGQLIGDAPVYLAASMMGTAATWEWLIKLWLASKSKELLKAWMGIANMQKNSPYLYAATFDSAFSTAAEYWVKKATWVDFTAEDGIRSLILWAIVPKAIGEITDATARSVKYGADVIWGMIKPKDFKVLDNVIKEGLENGETSIKNILEQNSTIKLSNWKTIGDVLENIPSVKLDNNFNWIDVSVSLANKGVSVSTMAAKRIASFVKSVNKTIDDGNNDAATLVDDLLLKVWETNVHDDASIKSIISEIETKSWVKVEIDKIDTTTDDVLSEVIHSPTFDIEKFKTSTSVEDIYSSFRAKWKTSQDEILDARASIEVMNRWAAKRVEELAKREWVDFDWNKAVDNWKTDKEYLYKVMDSVESSTIWYNSFSKKLLSEFREKAKSIKSNLTSATRADAIGLWKEAQSNVDTLTRDVKVLTNRLKTAATQTQKNVIRETIDKKNLQISKIKSEYRSKESDRKAVAALIKSEIDLVSKRGEFATVLSQKELKAVKDAYKARISWKTTLTQAEEVLNAFSERIYKLSYNKLTNAIGKQIKSVNKLVTTKSKQSKIDPYYVKLMNDVVEAIDWTPNLLKLSEVKLKLDNYEKEGRDIFTENRNRLNFSASDNLVRIVNEQNGKKIKALWFNSAEYGWKRRDLIDNVISFFGNNTQSHWYIPSMFGERSTWDFVFSIRPTQKYSRWFSKQLHINNRLVPEILDSIRWMEKDFDSVKAKLTLWRLRNSWANEWNIMNKMLVRKNWNSYRVISDVQWNIGKEWNIEFHKLEMDERQKILDSIYAELDNQFLKNKSFNKLENTLREYFDSVGNESSDILRRVAWKHFNKNTLHHPAIRKSGTNNNSILDVNGEYSQFQKDVINDGFVNSRKPPKDFIELNLDFQSNMMYHTNTALYWTNMVESVIDMEKTLFKLKSWNVWDDFVEHLAKAGKWENEWDKILDSISDMSRFLLDAEATWSKYLTPEAERVLRIHIGKFATRWQNIKWVVWVDSHAIVGKISQWTIPMILWGIKSAFKQFSWYFDATAYGWVRNAQSAVKSVMDVTDIGKSIDNIQDAMEVSWILFERQPNVFTKESRWRHYWIKGELSTISRIGELRDASGELFMTMMKASDWMVSAHSWFTWLAKYLDETHPELKTSGKAINLKEIRQKLSPEEFDDAVGFADVFMGKIMGSNQLVHAGTESQSILSKGVFYMGKTAYNHMLLLADQAKRIFWKDPRFKWAPDRALAAAYLSANLAATYALWQIIDSYKDEFDVMIGAKSEEDVKKKYDFIWNEVDSDSFWYKASYLLQVMVVAPSTWIDLTRWFTPLTQYGKKVMNAPTFWRKAEEAWYLALQWLTNVHRDYINIARKNLSSAWKLVDEKFDVTAAWRKVYDEAVSSIYSTVNGGEKPSIMELMKWETNKWVELPTWDKLDSLIKTQKAVTGSQKNLSDIRKEGDITEQWFMDWFLAEYPDASKESFVEYAKANQDVIKEMWITNKSQLLSIYTKIETQRVRSKWEENSILMWKPGEVIYDVKIKPLVDSWDYQWALDEIKILMESWVIKSRSWAQRIVEMAKKWASWR